MLFGVSQLGMCCVVWSKLIKCGYACVVLFGANGSTRHVLCCLVEVSQLGMCCVGCSKWVK